MNENWTGTRFVKTLWTCIAVLLLCPYTGVLFFFSASVTHSSRERVILIHFSAYCHLFLCRLVFDALSYVLYSSSNSLQSPSFHSIHPFPPIAHPHLQLCSIYHFCLVSIFPPSSLHALKPISPQPPSHHLVFSLYHRWSTFHAGFLHGLMPSLCVYAVCVLFVSPTCLSETHCFV